MTEAEPRVRVSLGAVRNRVDRALRLENDRVRLKRSRGAKCVQDLGEWFVLEIYRNFVVQHHIDLEAYARELGVLAPYEEMER